MRSIDLLYNYLLKMGFQVQIKRIPKNKGRRYLIATDLNTAKSSIIHPSPGGSKIGFHITSDKSATYEVADMLGVAFPKSISFHGTSSIDLAMTCQFTRNALQSRTPLVVKPIDSYQSKGLTTNITNEEDLYAAIRHALKERSNYIIQEQITGEEIRVTCLNGKAISVLLRQKPQIVGDGVHTIRELIDIENINRKKITSSLVEYPPLTDALITKVYCSECIPKADERIVLGDTSMIKEGASIYEIMDRVDSSFIKIAEKLSDFLPGGVVSVDIITNDYRKPAANNYALIEMNTGASLLLYYSCRDGNNTNILEEHIGPIVIRDLEKKSIYPSRNIAS